MCGSFVVILVGFLEDVRPVVHSYTAPVQTPGSLSNSKVSVVIQGEVGPLDESPPRCSGAVMVNGSFCSAKAVAMSQTTRHTTASTLIFWFSSGVLAGRP